MGGVNALGATILFVVFASLMAFNIYKWAQWAQSQQFRDWLVDGSCAIPSRDFDGGSTTTWSLPFMRPSWTEATCKVYVYVRAGDGSPVRCEHEMTWMTVTHTPAGAPHESCSEWVSKHVGNGTFECSFATGRDGRVTQSYAGRVDDLPDRPGLLLAQAAGFSLCTLGPPLLCCVRNAVRRASEVRALSSISQDCDMPLTHLNA